MNPEDVRKLVGGYATGSLSEAERKLLFEAALKDDELFDELAGEQVLKEILEEPGARQRLIAALKPSEHRTYWAMRKWAAGAVLAMTLVVIFSTLTRRPPPQEIAQVLKSAEPVAAPAPSPPPTPPAAPRPAAAPQALRKVAPTALADAPKPSVDAIEESRSDKAQVQALPAAPPPPAPQQQRVAVGAVREFAVGGGRSEALAANIVSVFGLNYTVHADGMLEIIPSSPGFLSVADGTNVLRPSGLAPSGAPVRVQIPAGTRSVTIGFYAVQGITSTAVRRDETSGTVTDQDPPNGRIAIQLFLTPGTQ